MSESRQFVNFLPVVLTALALALNNRSVNTASVAIVVALGLVGSKAWMTMNVPDMQSLAFRGATNEPIMQRYFMNHGPWMSMESYLWQAAAVLLTSVVLWFVFKPLSRS